MHQDRCICHLIPRWDLKTRVCLVVHSKELKRTTNTGRLAIQSLKNSEMRIRGQGTDPLDLGDLLTTAYHPLLLYPSEGAMELNSQMIEQIRSPILLIVPDGNWRQASKVHYRHQELASVQRVFLKQTAPPSKELLRKETVPNGMATLEAIAIAMGVIEGDLVGRSLQDLYLAKLRQTLLGRGFAQTE